MNINKMIKDLEDKIVANAEEQVKQYQEKFDNDFLKVANDVNDLYFKEVNKIYDSFIEQYYSSYETSSYIRHWEGVPGTKHGTNLLYGKQNKIHRGKDPYFEIDYNASDMADDYKYNSADQVLTQVMVGIRGVPPYWSQLWYGKYNSRYFHYTGALMDAYDYFLSNYKTMMRPVFMRRWKKIRST